MLAQTGEFLAFDDNQALQLKPMLASSWKPSANGTVWTFKLRQGVKFHNGSPMTADDVVYTFKALADPKNASNALSTFTGVLKPSGVVKVDTSTVASPLGGSVTETRSPTIGKSSGAGRDDALTNASSCARVGYRGDPKRAYSPPASP